VEAAGEGDDTGAPGRGACDLDGIFGRVGAGRDST